MILLVDDNEGVVKTVGRGLAGRGFKVDTALNGQEAFEKLMGGVSYECMVLDMTMPAINGAELLMLMQAEGIDIPVVVVSAFGDFMEEELEEFVNVKRFISKPFIVSDLADAIDDIMK